MGRAKEHGRANCVRCPGGSNHSVAQGGPVARRAATAAGGVHDSKAQRRPVPALLTKERREDRKAPEPRDVQVAHRSRKTRARRAILQARRVVLEPSQFRYSITVETQDDAVLFCLRAL